MGTSQSKRTLSVTDDTAPGTTTISSPHLMSPMDVAPSRNYDSVPVDFEARRHRTISGGSRVHADEVAQIAGPHDVPESVNQLLQAALGDEPGLNLSALRHDSNAAELRRPTNFGPGHTKLPTVFRWDHGGDEVYVAGSFSQWKRIPLVKSHDQFYTICELSEGEHEYKYIVDGAWRCDEKVETKMSGEHTLNNVIQVRKTDFEVFEALQSDVQQSNTAAGHKDSVHRISGDHEHAVVPLGTRLGSPPGVYTQEIPSRRALELEPPPPALPPHLLQVLLNKETAANYDPNLLPEPNHVMLNHLYALSIRDGVMVLSATHRYRKKYVTTLLYKPIQ